MPEKEMVSEKEQPQQQQPTNFLNHKFYKTIPSPSSTSSSVSLTSALASTIVELNISERMELECVMIRSVLFSFPSFFGPPNSTNNNSGGVVSMSTLFATLCTSHFADENIEACRLNITIPMIVNILHRLQDAGEVDVTMSNAGMF